MRSKFRRCCLSTLVALGIGILPVVADGGKLQPGDQAQQAQPASLQSGESGDNLMLMPKVVPAATPAAPGNDDGQPRGPGADNCEDATPAADGANPFDTTLASNDGPSHTAAECQIAGTLHPNVWFAYEATCTGQLTVTTCEDLGGSADYDTRIAVYSGTCGSLVLLGCNDDDLNNPCGDTPNFHSTVQILVTAGDDLLISVGGFSDADVGTGSLFISCNSDVSGACCSNGNCTDEVDEAACDAIGGFFQGIGTECATTDCPCGDPVYINNFTGGFFFAGTGVGSSIGNGVALGGVNRQICQVQAVVRNTRAPVDTPWDLRLNIWSGCPSSQSPPVTACGTTATLLYSSLMDTTQLSVAAGGAASLCTWSIPAGLPVPDSIFIAFEVVDPNTEFFFDTTGATIGARNTLVGLCLPGNSGCGWTIGGAADMPIGIYANPILEPGACCDISTGTCTNVAGGQPDCDGPSEVYTYGGFGGDCTDPEFVCVALLGACCNLTSQTCVDGILEADCDGADEVFSVGSTCANVICPLTCTPGGDGQIADYGGHGGSLGRTADLSPNFAGFRVADNFSPDTNDPLTTVRWWGAYRNFLLGNVSCTPQSGDVPDNFTITIWSDALGLPFQIIPGGGPHSVAPLKEDTGFDINAVGGARRVFQYTATGLNIPMEQDLCYWIEITNNTTGGDCQWLWLSGPEGDLRAVQHDVLAAEVPPWITDDVIPHDMAFCVNFPIADDTCATAIELPGACCIQDAPFCTSVGPSDCANLGGTFTATGEPCPNPVNSTPLCKGACCVQGSCIIVIQSECDLESGTWFGVGSDCDPDPCNGACCLSDGSCIDQGLNKLTCETALPNGSSGSWHGGESCDTVVCATFDQCDIDGVGTPGGVPVLPCNSTTNFNNLAQATDETDGIGDPFPDNPNPTCYGGDGSDDGVGNFWVAFTGTGSSVEISTCGSEVADTIIAVYKYAEGQGCPTLLGIADELACSEDDDACGEGSLQSRLCLETTVNGDTYYVQVTSFSIADVGNITVNVNCPCPVACACPGDTSGDGELDGEDVQSFADCLVSPGPNCACADSDGDGAADDEFGVTGDIADFVSKLLSGATCP